MSNAFAPSLFDASASANALTGGTSQLDTSQIDRNLRQISAVEGSWRQAAMPDEVRFDLATAPGMTEPGLLEFMTGLDDDLSDDAQPEQTFAQQPQGFDPRQRMPQQSGFDQARIILAGVAGNPAPQQVDSDAVLEFKRRAVRDGYLDMASSKIDSTWSPELNRVRSQMAYDDITESMRGNRFGAVPLTSGSDGGSSVMDTLNRLTSPTGLLAAATDLDLFWDFGAIGDEASSWGDKWRKLGQSSNPFDFAKNFVDAVTGPIDDVVFPVLNWASMALGVGAVWNGARVGFQGARLGGQAATGFSRLFNAGRVGRNLDEIGRASWTANRLLRSENAIAQGVGGAMAGYRASRPVIGAKSVLQPAMRMGVLSQAEDAFPGYQGGGFELSNIGGVETLQSGLNVAMNNPLFMPLEVLIAPYNIFTPGTFISRAGDVGALNKIGSGAFAALGTTGGRATAGAAIGAVLGTAAGDDAGDTAKGALLGGIGGALLPVIGKGLSSEVGAAAATVGLGAAGGALLGDDSTDIALGALAGIGLVAIPGSARASFLDQLGSNGVTRLLKKSGDAFQLTSFKPLAEEQFATLGFHSGFRRALQDRADFFTDRPDFLGDAPDAATAWDGHVDRLGVLGALAKLQGSDTETAAATIGFVFTSSVEHWVAAAQAGEAGSKGWWGKYHAAKNKLTNQLRRPTNLDNITPATIDDLATSMAWTEKGAHAPAHLPAVHKRARELRDKMMADPGRVLEFAADHERQAAETIQQLTHPTNIPKLDDVAPFGPDDSVKAIRDLVGNGWASETTEKRAWIMQQYMSQNDIFDTLVDYPKFAAITGELRDARVQGLLEAATLKPYKTRFGTLKSVGKNREPLEQPELTTINEAVTDRLLSDTLDVSRLPNTRIAPLASMGDPGRITVARIGTPMKADYEELAERLRDLRSVQDNWRQLPGRMDWQSELARLAPDLDINVSKISDLTELQISQIVKGAQARGAKSLGYVLGYARRNGLSMPELDTAITRSIDEVVGDTKLWKDFGFDEYVMDENKRGLFGVEALSKRLSEVNEKARYTAAEVDVEDLARYMRETGNEAGAKQVEQLSENLARDGYKAAHGVEYLMPEDLAHGPMFQDVTRRHLNAATLGNHFKGKLPVEAHIIQDRRHRLALAAELEIAPDSQDVDEILDSLRTFLTEKQDAAESILRNIDRQPIGDRVASRLKSSFTPLGLDDVGGGKKQLVDALAERWGDDRALAIWRATKKFRNTDFKDVGLYGLEAKARSMNVAEWGLKTLTGSKFGDSLTSRARGLAVPAAIGGAAGVAGVDPDASFEEKLKAAAMGGAVGAGVAVGSRLAATGASELARALPGTGSLVDRSANWSYGYMGDLYSRMRDAFRFTLSPMFDISRYTEGLMLAQTAAPLRRADGTRMALQLDMSPRGLQRSLRKKITAEIEEGIANGTMSSADKLSKATTARKAREVYQARIGQFQTFARDAQDFDPEALDATGRWFKSVGIMGFSPTDWMGTAFAHLVDQGLDQKKAYEAVKSMYTYGTKGRSAAEMSANFVFFPFSFQKKALGHIAKWMNDDLGRSIIIHDALKTYEMLDEKYDLDTLWKEHIPALQQLQKLNLFAYGISPGRLGGMNSQLFETSGKFAWNLFVPGALDIKSPGDAAEIKKLFGGLMPAINDITTLSRNVWTEQINQVGVPGTTLGSSTHQTRNAQISDGFNEWNEFKTQLNDDLVARGYVFTDIHNKSWLADIKQIHDAKKADLAAKYPAWYDFNVNSLYEMNALAMDRKLALDSVRSERIGGPKAPKTAHMIAEFEEVLEAAKADLSLMTGSSSLLDAPPEVFTDLRRIAEQFAQRNPNWLLVWQKFYERELGILTIDMELADRVDRVRA